jgi:hypothetical protein
MTTRREWLRQITILAAATSLPATFFTSCNNTDGALAESLNGQEPYATFRRLREAIRKSPDHLPNQLAKLVEDKDWRSIYQIIRDDVATLPNRSKNISCSIRSRSSLRWGTYTTARCSAGTLLEKTLLLQEQLTAAGLVATLHYRSAPMTPADYHTLFFREGQASFEPPVPAELLRHIETEARSPDIPEIDLDGRESTALAKRLISTMPDDYDKKLSKIKYENKADLPILIVETTEGAFALDLFSHGEPTPGQASDFPGLRLLTTPSATPPVNVSLKAVYTDDLRTEEVLLTQSYSAQEAVGRRLSIAFPTGLSFEGLSLTAPQDLHVFTPVCSVQREMGDPLLGQETAIDPAATFTVTGDDVSIENDGLVINGVSQKGNAAPALIDRVARLELKSNALAYPNVTTSVYAFDAAGKAVEGILPGDFTVSEDGARVGALLASNSQRPQVLLLLDSTTSLPQEYRSGAGRQRFLDNVGQQIRKDFPEASIKEIKTDDKYWTALAEVANRPLDLIVCFSDGKLTDTHRPELDLALANLPPVVFVHTDKEVHPDLTPLAEYIKVTPVQVEDQAAIGTAITEAIRPSVIPAYELRHQGRSTSSGEVTVVVELPNGKSATTTYTPGTDVLPQRRLAGLYLDVGYASTTDRFVLGGYDARIHEVVSRDHLKESFAALFADTMVTLEGGAPNTAVILDDILSGKLSTERALEVASDGDSTIEEVEKSLAEMKMLSGIPATVLSPLPSPTSTEHRTFPNSIRACVEQTRPDFETDTGLTRVSILRLSDFRTIAKAPKDAFRITAENTCRLAIAEAAMFTTSTYGQLKGEALTLSADIYRKEGKTSDPEMKQRLLRARKMMGKYRASTYHTFIGVDSSSLAFYSVDKLTGSVLAVLPDLTGGGASRIKGYLAGFDQAVNVINVMLAGVGAAGGTGALGGASLGLVCVHGQLLARLYGAASLAIMKMDSGTLNADIKLAVAQAICNAVRGLAYGHFLPQLALFEAIVGGMGGDLGINSCNSLPKPSFES